MEKVYIVFQGDAWLSSDSLCPLEDEVAYKTRRQAVNRIIREVIALRGESKADKDDAIRMVKELDYNQTQGLDTNFIIYEFSLR